MKQRSGSLVFVMLLIVFGNIAAAAEPVPIKTADDAVNRAGMQRMLSQRIAKANLMMALNVQYRKAHEQRDTSIMLFEQNHKALGDYIQSAPSKKAWQKVSDAWPVYKALATGGVTLENAAAINAASENLLAVSQALVVSVTRDAGTEQADIVNMSGRQRMLSQKIAKYYLLMAGGADNAEYKVAYREAETEFNTALHFLLGTGLNTPEITEKLEKVETQWGMFQLSHMMENGQYVPSIITRSTEKILTDMDAVTTLYTALGNPAE